MSVLVAVAIDLGVVVAVAMLAALDLDVFLVWFACFFANSKACFDLFASPLKARAILCGNGRVLHSLSDHLLLLFISTLCCVIQVPKSTK